jgi:hypothetical protein
MKEDYEKGGLTVNLSKRKYLHTGEQTRDLDLGNNLTITACDNYKDLGVGIGKDGRDEK